MEITMKRSIAYAAAIALMAGTAGTAFAKDHDMPADKADAFGQPRADESYVIGGELAKVEAKAGTLDSNEITAAAQKIERPAATGGNKPK
jgi:hypothetical protein